MTNPSPLKSKLTFSPAARATVPPSFLMVPLLLTSGAMKATTPPCAVISPWFSTRPECLSLSVKWFLLFWKFSSLNFCVLATKPPTSTCAVLPKITPLLLSKYTCPLAWSLPWISVGLLSLIRLSATLSALGCLKSTAAFAPILKLFHSPTILSVFC